MTFRDRLADWISGGALKRSEILRNAEREYSAGIRDHCDAWKFLAEDRLRVIAAKNAALQSIIACETEGANATVRRMAKIARGALK